MNFCPASFVQQAFVQRLFVHCLVSLCPVSREFLPSVQWAFVQSFCPVSFCLVSFCLEPASEFANGCVLQFVLWLNTDAHMLKLTVISGWILRLEGSTAKQRWGKKNNRNRQMYWLVGWLAQKWCHCSLHCVAVLCGWVQINSIFWRHTQRYLHSRSQHPGYCVAEYTSIPSSDGTHSYTCTT